MFLVTWIIWCFGEAMVLLCLLTWLAFL